MAVCNALVNFWPDHLTIIARRAGLHTLSAAVGRQMSELVAEWNVILQWSQRRDIALPEREQ